MNRKVPFAFGEYYHIYNRGTDKRDIFADDSDWDRFIKLLFVSNGTAPFIFRDFPIGLPYVDFERGDRITALGAYCLMSNHFHLLLKEVTDGGITKFMSKVLTSYSMYFNKKYSRSGRLFEGPFKASHVDNDRYLKYLFSYIHLNPVKLLEGRWKTEGIVDSGGAISLLRRYPYSSCLDYLGEDRAEDALLSREEFPSYFKVEDFSRFLADWMSIKNDVRYLNQ